MSATRESVEKALLVCVCATVGTSSPSESVLSLYLLESLKEGTWSAEFGYFEDPDGHSQYDKRMSFSGNATLSMSKTGTLGEIGRVRIVSVEITCVSGDYDGYTGKKWKLQPESNGR